MKYPPLYWSNPVMIQAGTKVGFVIPPPPLPPPGSALRMPKPGPVPMLPGAPPTHITSATAGTSASVIQPFQFFIKASRMGLPTHVSVEYQCASGTQERIVYVQQQPTSTTGTTGTTGAATGSTGPHPPTHPHPSHGTAAAGPPGNVAAAEKTVHAATPATAATAGASGTPDPTSFVRRPIEFEGISGGFDLDVFDVYSTATPPPPGIRIAIQPRYVTTQNAAPPVSNASS